MDSVSKNKKQRLILDWLGSGSINIFGMPFAGKDTQARRLSEYLQSPLIAGGDILRAHQDKEKIRLLSQTGELFPTDVYLEIILPYLSQPELSGKPLILSSVGRWSGEEKTIVHATDSSGHPIKAVLYIMLDEQEAIRRFQLSGAIGDRGMRHDDAEHVLEVRFKEFKEKTLPVIEYYRSRDVLIEINGRQSASAVAQEIIDRLVKQAEQ